MDLDKIKQNKSIKELIDFSIINLDKPSGPTSYQVCEKIRQLLQIKKTGHFGTLDPKVTGVLPIALNRACRLSKYFMGQDKEYIGKMNLHSDITAEQLVNAMKKFIGTILQKPPKRSRVKRVIRPRVINKFKILSKKDRIVEFSSDVSAGTYIRKLISDLGEKIGGAHMIELRRIKAGIFKLDNSYKIEQIINAFQEYKKGNETELRKILIPAEIINQIITSLEVKSEAFKDLYNGRPLMRQDILKIMPNSDLVSVFSREKFIGVYKVVNENDIIAKPEFVLN
jgi:H/ACA ribonucleoprotein complex subunit 4